MSNSLPVAAKRLLITGVNRATHADTLARLVPRYEALFACCIDIDHSAINTIGNAIETRRWARDHGFHSLMVVTSGYHMPRALAEIAHQLPDVTLVPFPVITEHQRAEPWWANAVSSARMVAVGIFEISGRHYAHALRCGRPPDQNGERKFRHRSIELLA